MTRERRAQVTRETTETKVTVDLAIDGVGAYEINTGIGMLDHLLAQLARHGTFDLKIIATGDLEADPHHTVEDIAIALGRAFNDALGERRGITRMGHALVPMDEALALVAVDAGGRGRALVEATFSRRKVGELPTDLIGHFLESFAIEGRMNLHARLLAGTNDHHKAEALFKALARALDAATRLDPRIANKVPSTKGTLSE